MVLQISREKRETQRRKEEPFHDGRGENQRRLGLNCPEKIFVLIPPEQCRQQLLQRLPDTFRAGFPAQQATRRKLGRKHKTVVFA